MVVFHAKTDRVKLITLKNYLH